MLQHLLSGRARLLTHAVGWLLVALLFFSLFSNVRGTGEALARTALNLAFLLVIFYGNAKWLVNRYFETGRYKPLIALTLAFWIGMTWLRTVAEVRLFGGSVFSANKPPTDGGVQMFLAYALSFFLLLLFSTLYQLLENRHALELRHRELEARHAEARLANLRAQINPHFLFNTLNNIYAAATLQHPNTAEMVLRLSNLLRYVTYDSQEPLVPLASEVAQVQEYIELYRLKSDEVFSIDFDVRGDLEGWQIEPLLLLPLVENALKHGNMETYPDAWLRISLQASPSSLVFSAKNTFDPDNEQKDSIGGVGLENLRQRLLLRYPNRHRMETGDEHNIFTAEMELNKTLSCVKNPLPTS
ncbi:MAG: sensor histidine kinase [Saprospiraceae bacterium]